MAFATPFNLYEFQVMAKGYWQIPMAKDSREKTAFATPFPGDAVWTAQRTSNIPKNDE